MSRRTGTGSAHAAVSVLNATATGTGCSLAITGGLHASWTPAPEWHHGRPDGACLAEETARRTGHGPASWTTRSTFPPSRGLKTSSGAAAALARAALDAAGRSEPDTFIENVAVEASLACGLTLTGAYDDQVATVRGGCHLTDNHARRIVASLPVRRWAVAVWVPVASVPKGMVRAIDTSPVRAEAEAAANLARAGDVAGALTRNGAAFTRLYAAAGLPVRDAPAHAALREGALGAGLSGTGPAVAALFDSPTGLPPVPGGHWVWREAVP